MLAAICSMDAETSSAEAAWSFAPAESSSAGGRKLLAARRNVACGAQRIADYGTKLRGHALQGESKRILVRQWLRLDGQIATRNRVRHICRVAQIGGHAVERANEGYNFVFAVDLHVLPEIAKRDRIGK